jgi:thiosulfate/3-mercaptopyruvate sulfurtransferase
VLQPQRLATKQWVESNLATPSVFVLDARSRGEYVGEDVRAARGGHVPGAVNLDWVLNLEEGAGGTFLGETELREMYDSIGVSNQGETVTLCQTGVRAAHTYFVLRNLGYDNVRMYDGSWAEWGNDASAPIVAGSSQR